MSLCGGIWNLPVVLDDQNRAIPSISKEDTRKLQTLQNTVLRLQTGLSKETSREYLL